MRLRLCVLCVSECTERGEGISHAYPSKQLKGDRIADRRVVLTWIFSRAPVLYIGSSPIGIRGNFVFPSERALSCS